MSLTQQQLNQAYLYAADCGGDLCEVFGFLCNYADSHDLKSINIDYWERDNVIEWIAANGGIDE